VLSKVQCFDRIFVATACYKMEIYLDLGAEGEDVSDFLCSRFFREFTSQTGPATEKMTFS